MIAKKFGFVCIFTFSCLLAYALQTYFYLEGDVIYLIHAAKQLLEGGNYRDHFFETNPPLILYLYSPIIWISNGLNISWVLAARLYVLGMALLSLCAVHYLLTKSALSTKTQIYLLAAITLIILFLPVCEFAQREHLLLILTMPYWFLAYLRKEQVATPGLPACLIGLFAALGFALKPFFMLPVILVEAYLYLQSPRPSLARPELLGLALTFILYALSLLLFQADYFNTILPLVSKYYFQGSAEQWSSLLDRPPALFCLSVCLLSPLICKITPQRNLAIIISLSLFGFVFSFLLPKTAWYYHILPALGMSCLLLTLLISELRNHLLALGLGLLLFIVPASYCYRVFQSDLAINNNSDLRELIQFASTQFPERKNYCFPAHHACSIVSVYGKGIYSSRFPSMWALRGILKDGSSPEAKKDETEMLSLIAEDFYRKKPDLVIFDSSVSMGELKTSRDEIAYLSRNALFKEVFSHYRYLQTIGAYEIYGLVV